MAHRSHRAPARIRRLRPIAAALCLWGATLPSWALDYQWFGGSGNWGDSAAWSPIGTPGSSDLARLLGGTATLSSPASVGSLVVNGNAIITGSGTLSVLNGYTFTAAAFTGGGALNLNANGTIAALALDDNRVVNNNAVATWNGGNIYFNRYDASGGAGTINNAAGATFLMTGNNTMEHWSGSGGVFNSAGLITKTGATGNSTLSVLVNNTGSIDAQAGSIVLNGGSTHSASSVLTSSAAGSITFARGVHSIQSNNIGGNVIFDGFNWNSDVATVDGTINARQLTVYSDADVVLNTAATAQNFLLSSNGRLRGNGSVTATTGYTLDGGYVTGNTVLQLNVNGSIGGLLLDDNAVLNNRATATWSGGNIYFNRLDTNGGGGTFNNLAGASFAMASNHTMENWSGTSGVFNNAGLITKTGATGSSTLSVVLNNTGTINAQAGTIVLNANGTHSAGSVITTSSSGTVTFGRGVHTLLSNQISGNITFDGFNWNSDVATVDGTIAARQLVVYSDADVILNTAATAQTFTLASNARLRGNGSVTPSESYVLDGGYVTGNTVLQLNVNGAVGGLLVDDNAVLNNRATATWSGGNVYFNRLDTNGGGGTFNNLAGASFVMASNHTMENWSGTSGVFNNAGLVTKTGATGTSTMGLAFNNTGTVDVQAGNLLFSTGSTHAAGSVVTTGTGGTATFGRGLHALQSGSSTSGNIVFDGFNWNSDVATVDGTLTARQLTIYSDADVVMNSAATAQTFTLGSNGRLRGAGSVTATNGYTLDGGYVTGNATLNLNASGSIGALTLDDNGTVNNRATATWASGTMTFNRLDAAGGGGRFNNTAGATFLMTGNNTIENWSGSSGVFANAGTMVKSGATGTTLISTTLLNTGLVDVQTGTLRVSSPFANDGTVRIAAGAVFHGDNLAATNRGTVEGNGTWRAASNGGLRNEGVISPGTSIGTLTIDGDLTQAANGLLRFELASTSSFDLLTITDDATFGGLLEIVNLGYTPVIGDSFRIITHDLRLGSSTFAGISAVGFGNDIAFTVTYNLHDVTLNVTAVPEPATWALWLGGIGAIGTLARRRRRLH